MIIAVQHASDPIGSQLTQLLQWPRLHDLCRFHIERQSSASGISLNLPEIVNHSDSEGFDLLIRLERL